MTIAQVKAAEIGSLLFEYSDMLIYGDYYNGLPCTIIYTFVEDYLCISSLTIDGVLTDNSTYIQTFNKNKAELTAKYGQPTTDEVKWNNNKYKNTPEQWGNALKEGHVSFFCEWDLELGIVSSTLERSKEGTVTWMLIYTEVY